MAKILFIGLMVALLCACGPVFAWSGLRKKIAEGNKLYAEGEYAKALTKYNDAQVDALANPEIFFNMGDVFFRQGKYSEAADFYQKSMEKGGVDVASKAMYNIGNALFKQGQLREALEYYKQALEKNSDDVDTKYNIEYTERMIKEMLSKSQETTQKAMEEQQKQEQQEQQSAKSGEQNGCKGRKEQEQKQAASAREDKKEKGEEEKGRQPETDKKKKDEQQGQEAKIESKEKEDLSEEEAMRFLSVFERDRKGNVFLDQEKSRKGRGYYVEKDW